MHQLLANYSISRMKSFMPHPRRGYDMLYCGPWVANRPQVPYLTPNEPQVPTLRHPSSSRSPHCERRLRLLQRALCVAAHHLLLLVVRFRHNETGRQWRRGDRRRPPGSCDACYCTAGHQQRQRRRRRRTMVELGFRTGQKLQMTKWWRAAPPLFAYIFLYQFYIHWYWPRKFLKSFDLATL